jgi:hypothetical protein
MDIFTIVRKTSLLTAIIFFFVIMSFAQEAKTPDNLTQQPASISKAAPAPSNNGGTDRKALPADPSRMSFMPAKVDNGPAARNNTNINTETTAQSSGATDNNKVNVVNKTTTNVTPQFNARKNATVRTSNNISPNTK